MSSNKTRVNQREFVRKTCQRPQRSIRELDDLTFRSIRFWSELSCGCKGQSVDGRDVIEAHDSIVNKTSTFTDQTGPAARIDRLLFERTAPNSKVCAALFAIRARYLEQPMMLSLNL